MGGSGRARGAGLACRAVFTNKGRARGLLAEPPASSSHLPVQGLGSRWVPRSLMLGGRSCLCGGLRVSGSRRRPHDGDRDPDPQALGSGYSGVWKPGREEKQSVGKVARRGRKI